MSRENLTRREMMTATGVAAATVAALGAGPLRADDRKSQPERGDQSRCLITMSLTGFEADTLTDEDKAVALLQKYVPIIAQEMVRAKSLPRTRGCSVSGTVTSGPGGVSGSGTITCTL